MDKKKYYLFALVVLALVLVAVFLFLSAKKAKQQAQQDANFKASQMIEFDDTEIRSTISESGFSEIPFQEVLTPEEIPEAAIKLEISESGFSPAEFKVRAGQKVSLALSAPNSGPHIFVFLNLPFVNLTAMVFEGEAQLVEFTAPEPGVYDFRDDIPANRSNTGQMIVEE